MKLLEKILMPVDVNRDNKEQVDAVIKIAKEFNSEITVMYVLPEYDLPEEVQELLNKYINEIFDKLKKAFQADKVLFASPIITKGNAVNKILEAATEQNSNLILVSSGKKTENDQYKLGTTAEKLVQLSDVPVLVSKSRQDFKIDRIMCPVDFSDPAKRALRNAILLSNNFGATLNILGVFEPYFTASPRIKLDLDLENKKRKQEFEIKMNNFLSEFNLKGVTHQVDIVVGIPHDKILKSIKDNKTDLLVMGTNGRSGFSRLIMGSVTEKVIREIPCSFVTTKTQNIYQLRLDSEVKGIEIHSSTADKLYKSGLYDEAIKQYLICLQINDMHLPSIYKLAKLYKDLGNTEEMNYYENMANDILRRLWDKKIEFEIRKHFKSNS